MTATATSATTVGERRPAWVVAAIAIVSVLAHVWMLIVHGHGLSLTLLMVGMTLWCSWCAVEAVVRPTGHCLQRLAVMSLVMVTVHIAMLFNMGSDSQAAGHTHHAGMTTPETAVNSHAVALLVIIGLELVVAFVSWRSLRLRRSAGSLETVDTTYPTFRRSS